MRKFEAKLNSVADDVRLYLGSSRKVQRRIEKECRAIASAVSVAMGGGVDPFFWSKEIDVVKTSHNESEMWEQITQYLSPHRSIGIKGVNLCPHSTPQCRKHCLGVTAGRMNGDVQQRAQVIRANIAYKHPFVYQVLLIAGARTNAARIHRKGKKCVARPNGDSDVRWEDVPVLMEGLREAGVDAFQDYTKHPDRAGWILPDYYVARSVTERMSPSDVHPLDVVIVDAKNHEPLPNKWAGMNVIDGDKTHGDLRLIDQKYDHTAVVLLRKKGSLKREKGHDRGFVKPLNV